MHLPIHPPSHVDKLDAVGSLRKRKRRASELEEEGGELSLTEYLDRKMRDQEGPKKKRVSLCIVCRLEYSQLVKRL